MLSSSITRQDKNLRETRIETKFLTVIEMKDPMAKLVTNEKKDKQQLEPNYAPHDLNS